MLTPRLNNHTTDLPTASSQSITFLLFARVSVSISLFPSFLCLWTFSYFSYYVLSFLSLSFLLYPSLILCVWTDLFTVSTLLFVLIAIWGQWLFKASRSKHRVPSSSAFPSPIPSLYPCHFCAVPFFYVPSSLIWEVEEHSGPGMCGPWAFRSF